MSVRVPTRIDQRFRGGLAATVEVDHDRDVGRLAGEARAAAA